MKTYIQVNDSKNEFIFGNFPSEYFYLIQNAASRIELHVINKGNENMKARLGIKKNQDGTIFILSTEKRHVNGNKVFKEFLNLCASNLSPIIGIKKLITKQQNDQTQELVHNLTSLNSYNIQDLFALIPQDILTKNITKQTDEVKAIINEKPNVAANTILQLIKYNLTMKIEFSVFEKSLRQNPFVQKSSWSIRDIILSILQILITDFEKNKIEVSLFQSDKRVDVDYDSLSVSLYYILENAAKYCCRNSVLKIFCNEEDHSFDVSFNMISIEIKTNEIDKICIKDFRSESAKSLNKTGSGIGMYRVLKTLKLNNAELEINPRISDLNKRVNGINYQNNEFKIKFLGQNEWFPDKI